MLDIDIKIHIQTRKPSKSENSNNPEITTLVAFKHILKVIIHHWYVSVLLAVIVWLVKLGSG